MSSDNRCEVGGAPGGSRWEISVPTCNVCGNPLAEHWRGWPCLNDEIVSNKKDN